MQYKQLQAFLSVIQTGSFSRAAEELRISQPSVSRLIKDLQEGVEFELFRKEKGRMHPTAEAMAFYDEVKNIFHGIKHLESVAENLRHSSRGRLSIGATPALATWVVPRIIKDFVTSYPDVQVSLLSDSVNQLMQGLRHAKYDLIITNHVSYDFGFIDEPLITVNWVCVMPAGHRLAEKEVINPQDLNGENLLKLVDEDGIEWNRHKAMLEEHNIDVRFQFATQRSLSGYGLVANGLCLSLLDPFNAHLWPKDNVVTRPFSPGLEYRYTMYYASDRIRSDLSRHFSACSKETVKTLKYE